LKYYDQISGQSVHRLEFLSDGVFAICLTLLVLDIKVPVSESIHTELDLWHAFAGLSPKLLTYFLSFMTLGIFWIAHTAQFYYIKKSDRTHTWINLFFLLSVTIIPFTTAFLSEHITFKFAIGLYWLNLFLLGQTLFINWRYADKHNFIDTHAEQRKQIGKAIKRRGITAQICYAGGALLCFINSYLSIAILIGIQIVFSLGIISGRAKSSKVYKRKSPLIKGSEEIRSV
jgi:uncharacterized membrane protein